ncbi:hypothetical protein FAZ95_11875 [Trinickia violacea]|uniref:Uncharacterized protein n=1 Tax=Trinickia violacea TaxID=2571746 RepID=A0A4P8IP33_9BURK|nr:hypothetical protein [Trinickia violacea]QCP49811.1 hypothetical protein FAZ95_11875 [Trinickia violacea]
MSTGSSDPRALGHSIWQRHTHAALNAGVRTREIGAAVYQRHADFVASAWRRMSGRGAADDAGESRPVVIGRRIHVDREAPESAMPATRPVARARVIPRDGAISRERASGGEHAGAAIGTLGATDDARPASVASTERIAGAPSASSGAHRVESAPVARTGEPVHVTRAGPTVARDAGDSVSPISPVGSRDSSEMVEAPPSRAADAHTGGAASTVRKVGDVVDIRDVGNDGSGAPSATPMLTRERLPDRPLADTPTIRGLPAAHARGADGSARSKSVDTPPFAVMRAPARNSPHSAGTTAVPGTAWQHASATAALPAVLARVPRMASAPKPLVVALHRWLGDVGGAAGPATGPRVRQPHAMTRSVDFAAAGRIGTFTRAGREVRTDHVTLSRSITLPGNTTGDAASRTPAAEARFDGMAMREAGASMPGEGVRSATGGPDLNRDAVDAEPVQRVSSAMAMPVVAARAESESASDARTEPAAVVLPAEPSPTERTVDSVMDANARSIVRWLRDTKASAGERAAAVHREADRAVVAGAATIATRTANDTGPIVARVIASPGVRATGHSGVRSDADSVARSGMAGTSVSAPEVLAHDAHDAHDAHTAHEPTHSRTVPTPVIARAQSAVPVQTVTAAQTLHRARTGSEAPPVATASAHVTSSREIRAYSDNPLATATHGKAAMALALGSAQARRDASLVSPSPEGSTVQRREAGGHHGSVALPDFALAPAHAGEPSMPAVAPARVAPSAHATAVRRGDTRMPDILRVLASAGPVAVPSAAVPEAVQSQASSVMRSSGVHARPGAATSQGVSRSEAAEPSEVERVADEYGVVPAALQRAATPPGAQPAALPAAPGAPHAGGRADDVNELAERVWQIIQDRLASERERRGYASWP